MLISLENQYQLNCIEVRFTNRSIVLTVLNSDIKDTFFHYLFFALDINLLCKHAIYFIKFLNAFKLLLVLTVRINSLFY